MRATPRRANPTARDSRAVRRQNDDAVHRALPPCTTPRRRTRPRRRPRTRPRPACGRPSRSSAGQRMAVTAASQDGDSFVVKGGKPYCVGRLRSHQDGDVYAHASCSCTSVFRLFVRIESRSQFDLLPARHPGVISMGQQHSTRHVLFRTSNRHESNSSTVSAPLPRRAWPGKRPPRGCCVQTAASHAASRCCGSPGEIERVEEEEIKREERHVTLRGRRRRETAQRQRITLSRRRRQE